MTATNIVNNEVNAVKSRSTNSNTSPNSIPTTVALKHGASTHGLASTSTAVSSVSSVSPAAPVPSIAQLRTDWTGLVDPSKLPVGVGPKAVGSGICANIACGPGDCKKCWESCGTCPEERDIYGCSKANQWALTFDDGPSPHTESLLDILDKLKVKATFFFLGSSVAQRPSVAKRAYDAGHLIASHTWSHPHLMSIPDDQIIAEVKMSEEAIFNATGVRPAYIRPPYGEADERVKEIFKQLGYRAIMWNMDCRDYAVVEGKQEPGQILQAFRDAFVKPTGLNPKNDAGFISLQHDLFQESVNLEEQIIGLIRDSGRTLHTVAECAGDADFYQDSTRETKGKIAKKRSNNAGDNIVSITATSGVPGDRPLASTSKSATYFIIATTFTGLLAATFSVFIF
ncbi:hypothetical protein BDF22DRAFT_619129 [Syncephalis plumigaleata]|nr:hypothetical protein BDF22DRAFT_619129 [Syncephalis plumigaleata]